MLGVFGAPGTYIPGSEITLKVAAIRGVESRGMMCSSRELELGDDHSGIIELPADAPVGAAYVDYAHLSDPVFDVAITPNRQDCMGVRGIARADVPCGHRTITAHRDDRGHDRAEADAYRMSTTCCASCLQRAAGGASGTIGAMRILVIGAGGVGMAAIQIAHHLGAEVIASAGSPAKRALLETLGVKHVIDSRRGDFTEAVMKLTDRRGVDVVLNALAGEAIPMGLSCLAEFGRFIEIGKRDIYQNSRIPLRPLRRNASFHVVAMDAVFAGDESLTREMLTEISDLVGQGILHPLPFRAFPANNVGAAFRLMAAGKHIGKVVVSLPETFLPRRGEPMAPKFEIKSDGCYLITGAFGGFGKVLANWLVRGGARHLVLSSRSGASTPDAEAFVSSLRDREVVVQILKADAGSPNDIGRLFTDIQQNGQPLRGVFHLAMFIDDAPLAALNRERMASVLGPKALGFVLPEEISDFGQRLCRGDRIHPVNCVSNDGQT